MNSKAIEEEEKKLISLNTPPSDKIKPKSLSKEDLIKLLISKNIASHLVINKNKDPNFFIDLNSINNKIIEDNKTITDNYLNKVKVKLFTFSRSLKNQSEKITIDQKNLLFNIFNHRNFNPDNISQKPILDKFKDYTEATNLKETQKFYSQQIDDLQKAIFKLENTIVFQPNLFQRFDINPSTLKDKEIIIHKDLSEQFKKLTSSIELLWEEDGVDPSTDKIKYKISEYKDPISCK